MMDGNDLFISESCSSPTPHHQRICITFNGASHTYGSLICVVADSQKYHVGSKGYAQNKNVPQRIIPIHNVVKVT